MEKILKENDNRFVLFPIKHPDIFEFYERHLNAFWTVDKVDLSKDDWENLSDNEKEFIKNILAFFAASDGIVNENLAENFISEVQYPEAKFFYGFQIMMENIHSHMYSLLIDTYIKNPVERDKCFNAISELPAVKKKAQWALKWVESPNFVDRLLAFAAVEMIFFSGSFAAIFWLKEQNKMPGLGKANEYIFKDENLHGEFAIHLLNNHIEEYINPQRIYDIFEDALAIETEFITESLPVDMIGMNKNLMIQYIKFIIDGLYKMLNIPTIHNVNNPFKFMEKIALESKTNFFEDRVGDYQKANLSGKIEISDNF